MPSSLKQLFIRSSFRPGIVGLLANPFYIARSELYAKIASLAPLVRGRVLDVGCGQAPYREMFDCDEYVGLELDTEENRRQKRADRYYDGRRFPFPAASFDTVLCNQVLEHVFNPGEFISEVHRVLRPGGGLLLTTPFVWDEHEQPGDYARYSSFGLRHLLEAHGLAVAEQRKSVADIRVLFQLANCYFYKRLSPLPMWLRLPASLLATAPLNIVGQLAGWVLPGNQDLYLDNVIFARKGPNARAASRAQGR